MDFFADIFGGFMVMLFILGFFLVVLWFILPFVVFAMKGKLDAAHLLLESIDRRLTSIENELKTPVRSVCDDGKPDEAPDIPTPEPPPSSSAE
jgi:hypothetical protein